MVGTPAPGTPAPPAVSPAPTQAPGVPLEPEVVILPPPGAAAPRADPSDDAVSFSPRRISDWAASLEAEVDGTVPRSIERAPSPLAPDAAQPPQDQEGQRERHAYRPTEEERRTKFPDFPALDGVAPDRATELVREYWIARERSKATARRRDRRKRVKALRRAANAPTSTSTSSAKPGSSNSHPLLCPGGPGRGWSDPGHTGRLVPGQ